MASPWIKAARLRTLPLTLVCIAVGTAAAYVYFGRGTWGTSSGIDYTVLALTVLTTLLLQILSNFANDYGDFVKGTDNAARVGPERALQSGAISAAQMKTALWILGIATLASGISLLVCALGSLTEWLVFFGLGLLSILAAITYTVGKNAYGYNGLGDVMVFLFFGLVGVFGSFYLQVGLLDVSVLPALLPAISVGAFSTGVLNMNNLRDTENDRASGKITIPVRIGVKATKVYQTMLVLSGLVATALYFRFYGQEKLLLWFIPSAALFTFHLASVWKEKDFRGFDKQLKICVLSTLVFGITFVLACYVAKWNMTYFVFPR